LLDNRTAITTDVVQSAKQQVCPLLSSAETEAISIPQTDIIPSNEEKEVHTGTSTPVSSGKEKDLSGAVSPPSGDSGGHLDTSNPYNLKYTCDNVLYQIKGFKGD
jgi:hypothetical protein